MMSSFDGYYLGRPRLSFHPALSTRAASDAFSGLSKWGPFDNSQFDLHDGALLFLAPTAFKEPARDLWRYVMGGHGRFKGFEKTFRKPVPMSAVSNYFFDADLTDPAQAATDYREAIQRWAQQHTGEPPSLAFVVVPKSDHWEVERPYYEAKAAFASMNIASQMVTTELLDDTNRLDWAAGTIALAAFAKLGGVPWAVEAPDSDSDIVIGIGRRQIRTDEGREMTFGYAVTFASNGLYRQTWSMSPAANQDSYLRRLTEAVRAALTDGVDDLDNTPGRFVIHLAKRTGLQEIEAVEAAVRQAGADLPLAFLRLDDSSPWDMAETSKDNYGPDPGTAVRLSNRAALLQVEGVTSRAGAPSGPLLIELDRRSSVSPDALDGLVDQVFRLAHANWRSFTGRTKPATLHYGEQLARLVGYMSKMNTWNPHHLPPDLKRRPWFL